ncbi:hypothetical protein [Pelagibaculum spongiae]|uniref:Uncharacterized protein n=1 Tax=Pelagibaculum spongiae TaxID=2080658 RepID=A0A2V1GYS4_9GAMM|nr:hypothetical protein [Pelagibaculum spongiae]PVZ67672.1 hypothetical protein DC094_14650 [Pelagibaculum spongiae]
MDRLLKALHFRRRHRTPRTASPSPITPTSQGGTTLLTSGLAVAEPISISFPLARLDNVLSKLPTPYKSLNKAIILYYSAYLDFCAKSEEAKNPQGKTVILLKILQLCNCIKTENIEFSGFIASLHNQISHYGQIGVSSSQQLASSLNRIIEDLLNLTIRVTGIEADIRHAARGRLIFLGAAAAQKYRVQFNGHTLLHYRENPNDRNSGYVNPHGSRPFNISSQVHHVDVLNSKQKDILIPLNSSHLRSSYLVNSGDKLETKQRLAGDESGFCCYIMDRSGNFYTAPHLDLGVDKLDDTEAKHLAGFFHSSYLPASSIACSGSWKVINGKLSAITNASGHFKPGDQHLYFCLLQLQNHVDISNVEVWTFVPPKFNAIKSRGKAPEFMKKFITGEAFDQADSWSQDRMDEDERGLTSAMKGLGAIGISNLPGSTIRELLSPLKTNNLGAVANEFGIDTSLTVEEKDWKEICRKITLENYLLKSQQNWGKIKEASSEGDIGGEWV